MLSNKKAEIQSLQEIYKMNEDELNEDELKWIVLEFIKACREKLSKFEIS